MNQQQEELYKVAEELGGYSAKALKAQALWSYEHRADKDAMKIASFVWGRNARLMAKAVDYFPEFYCDDVFDAYWYLSRFVLAQLSKKNAHAVSMAGSERTWQLWQYRDEVDKLKKRTHAKRNGHGDGDELAEQTREVVDLLVMACDTIYQIESDSTEKEAFLFRCRENPLVKAENNKRMALIYLTHPKEI